MQRFFRSRKGSVSVLTAVSLFMFIAFSAAAIDFGYVFAKSRQLQGMADLAAMAAATNMANAQQAAQATADSNGWSAPVTAAVVTGSYQPLPSLPPDARFTPGGTPQNAARVTLTGTADLFFSQILLGRPNIQISRTATAAQGQLASFSIGTRLAALNGGVANALLSALTGSSVSLSVMDYNALAGARVDLFQYVDALKTHLDVNAVSFDRTLSSQIATSEALQAIVDVLNAAGDFAAASAVGQIAHAANSTPISLGQLLDLGPYGGQDYVNLQGPSGFSVNALDLANAVVQLAQGGRQVRLRLNGLIPGVAGISAWLAIGERPAHSAWLTITDNDTVEVRTAQARLYLDAQVVPLGLAGVASVDLPLYTELASAKARLSGMACGAEPAVSLNVAPSIGTTAIGSVNTSELDDFNDGLTVSPAKFVDTLAVKATGMAQIDLGGEAWQNVAFDAGEIEGHAVKTVSTNDAVTAATSSLLGKLTLDVHVLGLSLSVPAVASGVRNTLASVAQPLDGVLNGLEGLLGVGLGQADLWVDGVRCHGVALVQ
jgi:uncharacterized membrane protein